jgi:hypothetical protein
MTGSSSKAKKDILRHENDKKTRNYASDFSDYSPKEVKKQYRSDSASTQESIGMFIKHLNNLF